MVVGMHDQDYIHNGKKLVNLLDSPMRVFQLGSDVCCLEHIEQVYQKFSFDDYKLKLEDIQHTDCQNWASAQKAHNYMRELRAIRDNHWERTLGIETYLQICANYIDIFLSTSLSLKDRIVLVAKVFFFFRIWKL